MNNNYNIPCECGHYKEVHPPYPYILKVGSYQVCDDCFQMNRIRGIKQFGTVECLQYKPSNLKYLEQLYEAKYK